MSEAIVPNTATNETVLPEANQPENEPQLVSKEAYDSVKSDMVKYKEEMRKMQARLDDLKVNTHKEKEDWKTVAQLHEEKAKDLEAKYSGLKDSLLREKKNAALMTEAQKHGINPASIPDLELLDFDEIVVETTSTGKILVSGQDRAIQRLKTLRPHWFTKSVPSVNPSTPEAGRPQSGMVSVADINAAETQWRKTKSDLDKQTYFDLIMKYKTQNG